MTNKISTDRLDTNSDIGTLEVGIANAHRAAFCSVMGEHTPGMNSDALALNLDIEQIAKQKPWLSLVCDGMSGNQLSVDNLGGHLAANFFVKELPLLWNMTADSDSIGFSKLEKYVNNTGKQMLTMNEVYSWLIRKMVGNEESKRSKFFRILLEQKELFLKSSENVIAEEISNKTAEEVANIVLIEKDKFLASLKLVYCLYEAVDRFVEPFMNSCAIQAEIAAHLPVEMTWEDSTPYQALTTMTGAIELEKEYMLFAIGDSRSFVVDEMGLVKESLTKKFSNLNTLTSCLGCTLESNNVIQVTPVVNGMMTGISIKFFKKEVSQNKSVLVSITDGLGSSDEAARCVASSIAAQISNIGLAIEEVLSKAKNDDETIRKRSSRHLPDDKTIVIIEKMPALAEE